MTFGSRHRSSLLDPHRGGYGLLLLVVIAACRSDGGPSPQLQQTASSAATTGRASTAPPPRLVLKPITLSPAQRQRIAEQFFHTVVREAPAYRLREPDAVLVLLDWAEQTVNPTTELGIIEAKILQGVDERGFAPNRGRLNLSLRVGGDLVELLGITRAPAGAGRSTIRLVGRFRDQRTVFNQGAEIEEIESYQIRHSLASWAAAAGEPADLAAFDKLLGEASKRCPQLDMDMANVIQAEAVRCYLEQKDLAQLARNVQVPIEVVSRDAQLRVISDAQALEAVLPQLVTSTLKAKLATGEVEYAAQNLLLAGRRLMIANTRQGAILPGRITGFIPRDPVTLERITRSTANRAVWQRAIRKPLILCRAESGTYVVQDHGELQAGPLKLWVWLKQRPLSQPPDAMRFGNLIRAGQDCNQFYEFDGPEGEPAIKLNRYTCGGQWEKSGDYVQHRGAEEACR